MSIFVINSVRSITTNEYSHGNSNFIVVNLPEYGFKVCGVYNLPDSSTNEEFESFLCKLEEIFNNNKKLILFGDLNINLLDDKNKRVNAYTATVLSNGFNFLNKIEQSWCTRETDSTKTLIDHCISDMLGLKFYFKIMEPHISDHKLLILGIKTKPPRIKSILYKNVINHTNISNDLKEVNFENVELYSELEEIIMNLISKHKKTVKITTKKVYQPYICNPTLVLMNNRDRFYKLVKKFPLNEYFKNMYVQLKKDVYYTLRKDKREYFKREFSDNMNNAKHTWQTIGKLLYNNAPKVHIISKIKHNLIETTDSNEIATIFNNFFCNVNQNASTTSELNVRTRHIFNEFNFAEITETQVLKYVNNLKEDCAQGVDGISTKFIKAHKTIIIPTLTRLINNVTFSANFPNELKTAKVIPIFKSSDSSNIANYRPISILPVLSKVFERNIYDQLINEINKHDLLKNNQYAYQTKSGTISACISFVSEVQISLDAKMLTAVLFVDFRKAFDSVNHKVLLVKLKSLGFQDAAYELLKSYLHNRKQHVQIKNIVSESAEINCGVPQGSILGPLFFLLFLNDLFDIQFFGKLQLYADDAAFIYSASTEEVLRNQMQTDLNLLATWCDQNVMTVNVNKTNYLIFDKSLNLYLSYNQFQISQVYKTKYLGLNINNKLDWKDHIEHVVKRISPMAGMLWRLSRIVPRSIMYKIYYAYINSNISYMLPIWGQAPRYQMKTVLGIQKRSLRALNCLKYLDSVKTFFSVNILPIEYYAQYETILLVYKMKNGFIKHSLTLTQNIDVHNYNTRTNRSLYIKRVRTNIGKLSLYCNGFKMFNDLPDNIKSSLTLSSFKKQLKAYILQKFTVSKSYYIN